jgi:hypothetical protein
MTLANDGLTLTIHDVNPTTGLEEEMSFSFTRSTSGKVTASTPAVDKSLLDQRLIGNWRRTESYVSGEFSFATDWHLQINSNGTYIYGEGRTVGGGPDSSIDSGDGRSEKGQWKAENQFVWLYDGERWQRYAKYYQEGNNLMFTFDNGSKQIWEKI